MVFTSQNIFPRSFMAAKDVVKTFIAIYNVRVHESWCVQCTFYMSTDITSQQTKYSHVVSQSNQWVNPSFLRYTNDTSTCVSLECLYKYNIVHVIHIRKSKISKYKSKSQGHTFIDLGLNHFTWNGVIVFMPNMKSLCLADQKLVMANDNFFYESNWQIHRQIGKNLHVLENCPFHWHIQLIFVWIF